MTSQRDLPAARRSAILALVFGLPVAAAGCAERSAERRVYVERLGSDTTAVEALSFTAGGYEGERLTRQPLTRVARYRADLDESGHVTRLEVEWVTPVENPDGPPPQHLVVELSGDSATLIRRRGRETDTARVEVPEGTVPAVGFPLAVATWQQAIDQLRRSGARRSELALLAPGGQLQPTSLARDAGDTVTLDFFGSPMRAVIADDDRVREIDGAATTLKIQVRPADDPADVDLGALAAGFAARDARGAGFGLASPRDTVETSSAGASLRVIYSRPAMRGRRIWGGLVPHGEVWRTGANAATHFTTDRALRIREVEVPAGTYTLWTIFTGDGGTLILNEQTGIWGTAHDPAHDLARVPLEREELDDPVERFTIGLEPTEQGAFLSLAWDRTRFGVPLRVR